MHHSTNKALFAGMKNEMDRSNYDVANVCFPIRDSGLLQAYDLFNSVFGAGTRPNFAKR